MLVKPGLRGSVWRKKASVQSANLQDDLLKGSTGGSDVMDDSR
jgi:hypothetical protein